MRWSLIENPLTVARKKINIIKQDTRFHFFPSDPTIDILKEIHVLDFRGEPTTGIDILGARTVRNLIKRLSKEYQKTIILTTHDLSEVEELCDRVGILVKGKLAAVGRPDELEEEFKQADIEDVFIGLTTGEGVLEEEMIDTKKKGGLLSHILRCGW